MGPAIISVLFGVLFAKIYGAFRNHGPATLRTSAADASADLEPVLRFARTVMNVGLFWFFIQGWAEKAGYLNNSHSRDEIDLPFEFGGTLLGFWMARVLTKPFSDQSEKFRSSLLVDFLCTGVFGLVYTLMVGPLTETVANSVAHGLYPVVPGSLAAHEYTSLQQHMRPFELLLLAGAMWWGLNWFSKREELTQLNGSYAEPEETDIQELRRSAGSWDVPVIIAKALGVTTGYLAVLATMLSFLEPQGLSWTLATMAAAILSGTAALFLIKRAAGLTTVFERNDGMSKRPDTATGSPSRTAHRG
jgi:uncharacterized protein YacL